MYECYAQLGQQELQEENQRGFQQHFVNGRNSNGNGNVSHNGGGCGGNSRGASKH